MGDRINRFESDHAAKSKSAVCYGILALASAAILFTRWHTLDEPLDCDEAAYSYVAHRVLAGDRLYADVFENKPPLAYAPYAAAIALAGYAERSIRLLSVPLVIATLWLLGLISRAAGGTSMVAATCLFYWIASSDPFVFGNGSNLELFMNFFLALGLLGALIHADSNFEATRSSRKTKAAGVAKPDREVTAATGWKGALLAGIGFGAATAMKQVAGLIVLLHFVWLLRRRQFKAVPPYLIGAVAPWLVCAGFVAWQGVWTECWEATFRYGPALAAEASSELQKKYGPLELRQWSGTLLEPLAYSSLGLRALWFCQGNPHASAWWAAGSWPALVLLPIALLQQYVSAAKYWAAYLGSFLLVIGLCIVWPGMFWQHYYMLAIPAWVLVIARSVSLSVSGLRKDLGRRLVSRFILGAALIALVSMAYLQWIHYWKLSSDQITTQHKGGGQWVAQRKLARTTIRTLAEPSDSLFVWGVQSPLHFYSGLDSVTPYFFTDPLLQATSRRYHAAAEPHQKRIIKDLETTPPSLIFVGEPPPRAITRILQSGYQPVSRPTADGRGLYLRRDLIGRIGKRLKEDLP